MPAVYDLSIAFWTFVDEFPTTVTGRVQKLKMREAAVAEFGLKGAGMGRLIQ